MSTQVRKVAKTKRQALTKQAEFLVKKYRFQKDENEKLLNLFSRETKGKNKMDRNTFRNVLHNCFDMTDDIIMDRVFKAFDKDNDSQISAEEWIRGMCIFLRGTFDERITFCFDVYDMNSDGYISREEMFHLLKLCIIKQTGDEDPDEGIKELVEIALKKADQDHDNRVSFADYQTTCRQESLLLEFLGQCLPTEVKVDAFECLLRGDPDALYQSARQDCEQQSPETD